MLIIAHVHSTRLPRPRDIRMDGVIPPRNKFTLPPGEETPPQGSTCFAALGSLRVIVRGDTARFLGVYNSG